MQLSAAVPARPQGSVSARGKEAQTQVQFESPELKVIRFEAKDILTTSETIVSYDNPDPPAPDE